MQRRAGETWSCDILDHGNLAAALIATDQMSYSCDLSVEPFAFVRTENQAHGSPPLRRRVIDDIAHVNTETSENRAR